MKKRNSRLLACALAVVLCMTAFSIPTFAAGYYASNENGNNTPPDAIESITVSTENVNLPANSSASGIPALTPDGNLSSICLLYTSPSPRDISGSRMPSSA